MCSVFLQHAETSGEKWGPYIRWASKLRPSDTIITFNYDLVLEKLAASLELASLKPKFSLEGISTTRNMDESVVRALGGTRRPQLGYALPTFGQLLSFYSVRGIVLASEAVVREYTEWEGRE